MFSSVFFRIADPVQLRLSPPEEAQPQLLAPADAPEVLHMPQPNGQRRHQQHRRPPDPPVMILDEATSSIDTRTEAIVQRGMDKLMEGRTVFVIAHRLSTVMNSDVIMVLDHGRIIERGSHEKLLADKGTYYQLYTGAFELE